MCLRLIILIVCLIKITKSQQSCAEYFDYISDEGERRGLIQIGPDEVSARHLIRVQFTVKSMIDSVSF